MLQIEYKKMIEQLITATGKEKLNWFKDKGINAFYTSPNAVSKVAIDSYYTQFDNSATATPCVSVTIFNTKEKKLVDEIILCNGADPVEDYTLLNELYQIVKNKYSETSINPTLTSITSSLQAMG